MQVKEFWRPKPMTATGTLVEVGGKTAGFLCTSSTSGTIKITSGTASGGTTIVDTLSVTAGVWYPIPFYYQDGAYVTISSCAGTFGV